jgi:hypothetical protein
MKVSKAHYHILGGKVRRESRADTCVTWMSLYCPTRDVSYWGVGCWKEVLVDRNCGCYSFVETTRGGPN